MIYVLDACAMIAYLLGEEGADVVESALLEATTDPTNCRCYAHSINLCELFYIFHRDKGVTGATNALADLRAAGVTESADIDEAFWQEAALLKSGGRVSLADSFALTLTTRVGGTLLTSDHHELDRIAALGIHNITFIR